MSDELNQTHSNFLAEYAVAINEKNERNNLLEPSTIGSWAQALMMKVKAMLRHWSQSVLNERKWLPAEFLEKQEDEDDAPLAAGAAGKKKKN